MLTSECVNKWARKVHHLKGATGGLTTGFPVQSVIAGIQGDGISRELQEKNRQAAGMSPEELRRSDTRGPAREATGSDIPEHGSEICRTFL